jgi:DNA-binding response OmpR family regulator
MHSIMSVDNEPDTVDLVKFILEKEGMEVTPAYSGKECLEKLANGKFELVLLDIMMPDMSGWDVFTNIKKMKDAKKPKVAFLSAIDVSAERRKVLVKSGISDYITKPFDNDDLVKRVKSMLKAK